MSKFKGNIKDANGNILQPGTDASIVEMPDAQGGDSTVQAEVTALRTDVAALKGLKAINIKGMVDGATNLLPTTGYKAGDEYIVAVAGTYAGRALEVNDTIVCVKDYEEGTASNADWIFGQVDIDTTYLKKLAEDANGNPTYNGTVLGGAGIPVVENGASAPTNLVAGGCYFEKAATV